jgi:hypothetical protein
MKSQKTMDIRPPCHKGRQRQKSPFTTGRDKQPADKKNGHRQQQQGKDQSKQRNDPPSSRMQKDINAGQQEKNDRNDVQNDEQTAGKYSESRHG